ncbi:hypothetical protein RFI_18810 [Reticulomyxa filosa]|uniref:60S acidic ribosomal protein P2 n=1 Tax=Reticulomyxa filosa TaxID=46433 RepID=X6MXC2_RETFI|nr:hypothetical protein RFI_18810 [Reticulomyxa filosa]|eukprot:ETO18454.1 hypothetical protein RFI_18810 [Reticulomyxa filosa]
MSDAKNKLGSEVGESVALATLILVDGGVECSSENISKLLTAANVNVGPSYPKLFSEVIGKGLDVKEMVNGFGKGGFGGGAPAAAAPAAQGGKPAEAAKEEKEKEKEESEGMSSIVVLKLFFHANSVTKI